MAGTHASNAFEDSTLAYAFYRPSHMLALHLTLTSFLVSHHHRSATDLIPYPDREQAKPSPRKVAEIKCVIVLRDTLIVY